MAGTTAFFYGTLMHPKILKRVIGNDGAHLEMCQAVLLDFTRHKVKFADYPGLVPYKSSRQAFFDHDLDWEDKSVRGTLVKGLTVEDMGCLDIFEGIEYTRVPVEAHPLSPFVRIDKGGETFLPSHPPPLPQVSELPPAEAVDTYVYNEVGRLEPALWDFEEFVKLNAWKWYGEGADVNSDFTEVDRRRASGRIE